MNKPFIPFANKTPRWQCDTRLQSSSSANIYCLDPSRVQTHLHAVSDALAVRQELRQVLGSQDIPERGLSQKAS